MKKASLLLRVAFGASLLGLGACSDSGSRAAPPLSLPVMSGGTASLAEQKGRVVLVNFWATWCPSCREELPALAQLQAKLKGRPFTLLSVNLDADARVVPPFAKKHGIDYPILGADDSVLAAWGVRGLPATFLVGPGGAIEKRWLGPIDAASVENDILALLERRPL